MTDINDGELLPCPFCGGKAELVRRGNIRYSTIVECTACGCKLESPEVYEHGSAWNTRARPQPSAEVVEALRPFAACVYNDNGDITIITSDLRISHYMAARSALNDSGGAG